MVNRYRPVVPVAAPVLPMASPVIQPCGCGSNSPDICQLIQLANALNGQSSASNSGINVDDMINKLLNALLAVTVGQGSSRGGSGSGSSSGGSGGSAGSSGSSQSSNPIIGLDLLGPNGLIAQLGLGGTKVLDVGAGGSSPASGVTGLLENVLGTGLV